MNIDVPSPLADVTMGDVLEHRYDPAYARAYYLRTRKLKGRPEAEQKPPGFTNDRGEFEKHATGNEGKYDRPKSAKQRREELEARKARLRVKFAKLEAILAELVRAAKERSGVETKKPKKAASTSSTTTDKASSKSEKKSDETPATASEKKEAAKRAREHYEKTKPKGLTPAQEVQHLEQKIEDIQSRIKSALEDARRNKQEPKSSSNQRQGNGR